MQPAPAVNPYQVTTIDQVVLQPPRLDPKVRLSNNAGAYKTQTVPFVLSKISL